MRIPMGTISAAMALFVCVCLQAGVERLEITGRKPFDENKSFGKTGPYELVQGKAHMVIDPKKPENKRIVDLNLAIPDKDGLVRYQSDFLILCPADASRGNGSLLVDIPNRGNPVSLLFNFPQAFFRGQDHPWTEGGDGFLMEQGFTLVSIGWQPDIARDPKRPIQLGLTQPELEETEGLVRSDIVFSVPSRSMPLSHWGHDAYPASNPRDDRNRLTVRDHEHGERRLIPAEMWRFGRWEDGKLVNDPRWITLLEGDFQQNLIYEAVYVSRKPRVVGLGLAAIRDLTAYLHHHEESPVKVSRTLTYGVSQTGRLLRHFLWEGLNTDLEGKRVFDGVFVSVAGAGRGLFNQRFAQPSRFGGIFETSFYPVDIFPFTDKSAKNPYSGRSEGLLDRVKNTPKLFQFNTGHEYWGRAASLIHTTPDGKKDHQPDENSRIYATVSTQHGPSDFPPDNIYMDIPLQKIAGRHPLNPTNYVWCQRALLLALDDWVALDQTPPPNRYPTIEEGTLLPADKVGFPAIPGVKAPVKAYTPHYVTYGDRFLGHGIIDRVPPTVGGPYGVLVPATDEDGNELGGIRLPEVAVPLATQTGWNWRDPSTGAPGRLMILAGAWFPLAKTKAERMVSGDSRLSIEERYKNRTDFLGRFTEAARELIRQGYLLPEDLPDMVDYANTLWRHLHGEAK